MQVVLVHFVEVRRRRSKEESSKRHTVYCGEFDGSYKQRRCPIRDHATKHPPPKDDLQVRGLHVRLQQARKSQATQPPQGGREPPQRVPRLQQRAAASRTLGAVHVHSGRRPNNDKKWVIPTVLPPSHARIHWHDTLPNGYIIKHCCCQHTNLCGLQVPGDSPHLLHHAVQLGHPGCLSPCTTPSNRFGISTCSVHAPDSSPPGLGLLSMLGVPYAVAHSCATGRAVVASHTSTPVAVPTCHRRLGLRPTVLPTLPCCRLHIRACTKERRLLLPLGQSPGLAATIHCFSKLPTWPQHCINPSPQSCLPLLPPG